MPPLKRQLISIRNATVSINDTENNEKITVESFLTVCSICGQEHATTGCQFFLALKYVKDEPLLSRARLTLPKNLEITKMADGSTTVITKCDFQQGTTFGPLQAQRDWTMNPMNEFPIKVFGKGPMDTFHLDRSNENASNWMCFVSPASNSFEQNLVCYQMERDVYYTAMRFIPSGEELRVWYAPYYALKMKMPLYNTEFANVSPHTTTEEIGHVDQSHEDTVDLPDISHRNIEEIVHRLPAEQLGALSDKTSWNCTICSVVMNSVIEYAKHLMEHYKPLSGVFCDVCNKKFHRLSVLEKHKRSKHPKGRTNDDVAGILTSENQQQQNAQTILMNMNDSEGQTSEAMKDILVKLKTGKSLTECSLLLPMEIEAEKENPNDLSLLDAHSINVNDLLPNNAALTENSSLKSILENQCLNLSLEAITDSMLSDNTNCVDSDKFNVEELTSEFLDITPDVATMNRRILSFQCDICEKKFGKADYLYRHLRKHTGEFVCPSCLGVFARKENLMSHLCPSQQFDHRKFECSYCQKLFLTKKYLKRHMAKHTDWNVCKWCRNLFTSRLELEAHKCQAPKHDCSQCGKRFVHREHLNRHAKSHTNPKPVPKKTKKRLAEEKPAICEKCGDVFKNPHSLKQHLRSHGERKFECDICHSKFHRIGVLQQHKSIHQSIQIPCQICGKKFKSKKALSVHILLHGNRKFHCEKCDKSFFQRCNYLKHYRQMHGEKVLHKCPHCPTEFTSESSFNKHVESHVQPSEHACKSCHKVFHREYQLKRHVRTNHSGIVYRCPYCKMTARYRHSMRRHFERQHESLSDEWNKPGFVNDLVEKMLPSVLTERAIAPDQSSLVAQMSHRNNAKFEAANDPQNSSIHETPFGEKTQQVNDDVQNELESNSLNGQEIVLPVSEMDGEVTPSEIPQLSISDNEANLAESVLSNAYIFGEDGGDIMCYVLDGTPVITQY
ncbi:zinc finger protein 236-like [Venturia canescens]|uniref:zinc finger protein 236-like n=1 Tax=Venturia canescens TaxID=32260 RepID=UPI001C9C3305|nr:zinc finger protein 236-like [Venturia canescens]